MAKGTAEVIRRGRGRHGAWRALLGRLSVVLLAIAVMAVGALSSRAALAATDTAADPQVRAAQEALRGLGYDPGPADGLVGGRTRRAIEIFQGTNALPVTGTLDSATVARLLTPSPGQPPVRAPRTTATGPAPPAVPVGGVEAVPLPGSVTGPPTAALPGGTPAADGGGFSLGNYAGLFLLVVAVVTGVGGVWWIARHMQPEAEPDGLPSRMPPTLGHRGPREAGLRAPARQTVPVAASPLPGSSVPPGAGRGRSRVTTPPAIAGTAVTAAPGGMPTALPWAESAGAAAVSGTAATVAPGNPAASGDVDPDGDDAWPTDPRARSLPPRPAGLTALR